MNNPDDMLITGVDASGNKRTILVNADGSLVTTGGSGGGGGGGATAAEIKTAIETATNLDGVEGSLGGINGLTEGISDAIGTSSDLKVFDANADATLMSLIKGQLGWLEDILNVLNTNNVLFNRVDEALGTSDSSVASSDTGTFSLIQLIKRLLSVKLPDAISGKIPVTSINYLSGFTTVDRTTTGTFYEGVIPQSKSLVFQVTGDFTATNIITQSRIGSTFDYETIDIYSVKKRDWVSSVTEAGIYVVPNNAEAIKIELTAIFTGTVSFDYILRDDNLISYKQTLKQSYFDSSTVNVSSSSGATFYVPTTNIKKVVFTNNSTNTVFFDFTSSVSSSNFIFKLEPGDTFIDEGENINKDATYFAVANTATSAVRVARWF